MFHQRDFVDHVRRETLLDDLEEAEAVVGAVMALLWEHVLAGTVGHIGEVRPADLRSLIC